MPRGGKAKSGLAPIKDIIRSLELNEQEGPCFKALTLNFLTKTKKLQVNDIIDTSDRALYKLARELLETETTPGEGPTGFQYWPIDDTFRKALTYAANPSRIIKLVSYIMRNQRKNLLSARTRRRRQIPQSVENCEPETEAGPSSTAGANLDTDLEPAVEEREATREVSREFSELPTYQEILSSPREVRAAPNSSDSTDPPSHLATPPITPALSNSMQRSRMFHDDSPHPSVEHANTTTAAMQNFPRQQSPQYTTEVRDRRRERSHTIFGEYNPRLPTHRDGTLDEASIKSWKDGVAFVRDRMEKFNRGLRRDHREHPMATLEEQHAALQVYYKSVGLDEFQEFLDNDLQKQQKRLSEFKASRAALGGSEELGISRTFSP